jgi:D-glycero-alpha-D-manno-heptose 1-phosphate guanylyltransferase
MEAIVLAGGLGTRLREVIADLPKPMAPLAGRPFLEILLAFLSRQGVQRAILSIGYRAEVILEYFGDNFDGIELRYAIEQTPLGTGGAIRAALQHCTGDHVLVVNGDTFIEFELAVLQRMWATDHQPIIVARHCDDTARYGRLEVRGGQVVSFLEKGGCGPGLINAGAFVLPVNFLDCYSPGERFQFETGFLVEYVKTEKLQVYVSEGRFIDIGIPQDYQLAQALLSN